jgi:hypothetical protein
LEAAADLMEDAIAMADVGEDEVAASRPVSEQPPLLPRGAPDPIAEDMDGVSMEQWRKNMNSSRAVDVPESRAAGKSAGWRKSVKQSTREQVMERLDKPPSEPLIPLMAWKATLAAAAPVAAEEEKPEVVDESPVVQGWRKSMERQINDPKRSKLASSVTDAAALSISRPRGTLTARPGLSKNFSEEKAAHRRHNHPQAGTARGGSGPSRQENTEWSFLRESASNTPRGREEVAREETTRTTAGTGRKLDHLGRGADFYKALRGQSCALFTFASFAGLLFAIWANEVLRHTSISSG